VLGFIGLIHAEHVDWNVGGQIALGYALAGVMLLLFGLTTRRRVVQGEAMEMPTLPGPREPTTDGAPA
jgi:hypothetical protein